MRGAVARMGDGDQPVEAKAVAQRGKAMGDDRAGGLAGDAAAPRVVAQPVAQLGLAPTVERQQAVPAVKIAGRRVLDDPHEACPIAGPDQPGLGRGKRFGAGPGDGADVAHDFGVGVHVRQVGRVAGARPAQAQPFGLVFAHLASGVRRPARRARNRAPAGRGPWPGGGPPSARESHPPQAAPAAPPGPPRRRPFPRAP